MVLVKGLGLIELQETSFGKQVNISDDIKDLLMLHPKALLKSHFLLASNDKETNTIHDKVSSFKHGCFAQQKTFLSFKSHVF